MVPRFRGKAPSHLRCPQCGMECFSPQPDDSTLAGIYNETYFSHYQSEIDSRIVRAMKRATYGRQIRQLPPAASFGGQRRLLDCGAVTGFFAELATEFGWNAFAIEILEFVSQARMELLGRDKLYRGE